MNPTSPNADQIAFWNGPAGERWAREQDALDRAFEAFTARLLAGAGLLPGQRVLDVGCGCGTTTLAASAAVGAAGSVLGVDVSVPMLERAKRVSAGRANVTLVHADASAHTFEGELDVILSRFGVMFFRDPTAAFANLRTALRPGGRLVFASWRAAAENEWARLPYDVATRHVPPAPPPGPEEPGPFSFGDRARVERILTGAGFTDVAILPFDAEVVLSEEGFGVALDFAMTNGHTGRLLRDAPDDVKNRVREALAPELRAAATASPSGRFTLGGAVWIVSASAPGRESGV